MKKLLTLLLLFAFAISQAQTRLRPYQGLPYSYAPGIHANWNVSSGNGYIPLLFGKYTNSSATVVSGVTGAAAVREILNKTWVTPTLAAQTIASGSTISFQIKGNISSTSSRTGQGKIYIRVMNEDGTIASEVGSCVSTNFSATLTNRTYSFTLGSDLVITAGQRILFEVGMRYLTGTDVNTTNSTQYAINNLGTDLAVDNTTTTSNASWVEFPQTLIWGSGYTKGIML